MAEGSQISYHQQSLNLKIQKAKNNRFKSKSLLHSTVKKIFFMHRK